MIMIMDKRTPGPYADRMVSSKDQVYESISTADQEALVNAAICAVAARCDGAVSLDGIGFNGQDTKFGRRVAQIPFEEWTPEIKLEAARIASTYAHQIREYLDIEINKLPIVIAAGGIGTQYAARDQARAAERERTSRSKRVVTLQGDLLVFSFPFSADVKDALKEAGRGAFRYDGFTKTWRINRNALNRDVVGLTITCGFRVENGAEEALESAADVVAEKIAPIVAQLDGDVLRVTLVGHLSRDDFNLYRGLDGYHWLGGSDSLIDITPRNIEFLKAHESFSDELDAQLKARNVELEVQAAAYEENIGGSLSSESDLDLSDVVPAGLAPYPFQVAGVDYALKARRTFIADEMGLGKTVQAILACEKSNVHPVIVVCPASLKGNWAREIRRWAPSRSVDVLSGRGNGHVSAADYVVVNYDIFEAWSEKLSTIKAQALIVDESHYAKNPAAKRTKALVKFASEIPKNGLVLLLTGTPILNRPVELVTQLRIIDRLREVAPTPRGKRDDRGFEFAFKFRYCNPENNGWGWTFNGCTNGLELNEKLRSVCMVRRERNKVLNMKATIRTRIPFTLNGGLDEYRKAEENIIGWIFKTEGSEAANRARRAEMIVRLNKLRTLAEEAKIAATIEWVEDWLESYPDKSLVIFAEHVAVQHALRDHFSCPTILAGQKDVEAQKERFQSGAARVLVCSLGAAREGHTLTAASDVVFTSLGWTPGGLQQAEDRCNRIGQESDKVVAWQLLAEDTIEEEIASLIDEKRKTFNKVVIGEGTDDEDSIIDGVVAYLMDKQDRKFGI